MARWGARAGIARRGLVWGVSGLWEGQRRPLGHLGSGSKAGSSRNAHRGNNGAQRKAEGKKRGARALMWGEEGGAVATPTGGGHGGTQRATRADVQWGTAPRRPIRGWGSGASGGPGPLATDSTEDH
jgi:hypothetical protein